MGKTTACKTLGHYFITQLHINMELKDIMVRFYC